MASKRWHSVFFLVILPGLFGSFCFSQEDAVLTVEQKREFLLNAEVIRFRTTREGITVPYRLTLTDGKITHDGLFQSVNERRPSKKFRNGTTEINFVDSYLYNIAAYELSTLIGLDTMLPVTVPRKWKGKSGSLSWWLPVQMSAADRFQKKIPPPDVETWNRYMYNVRLFGELIYDTDRNNLQNTLIGKHWEVYMIDFTRAFRRFHDLRNPENLLRCSRELLGKLRNLKVEEVRAKVGEYLNEPEIEGVMKRRDKIVAHFDKLVAEKGENAVLF
jgi:hypothetical protein